MARSGARRRYLHVAAARTRRRDRGQRGPLHSSLDDRRYRRAGETFRSDGPARGRAQRRQTTALHDRYKAGCAHRTASSAMRCSIAKSKRTTRTNTRRRSSPARPTTRSALMPMAVPLPQRQPDSPRGVHGDSAFTDGLFAHAYRPDKVGSDTFYHDAAHPSRLVLPVLEVD